MAEPDPLPHDVVRQRVAAWAQGEPLIRAAWLFGSRARGEHRPDSDVDVAVLFDPEPAERRTASDGFNARWSTWKDHGERWHRDLADRFAPVPVQLERIEGPGIIRESVKAEGVLIWRRR